MQRKRLFPSATLLPPLKELLRRTNKVSVPARVHPRKADRQASLWLRHPEEHACCTPPTQAGTIGSAGVSQER